MHDEAQAQHLRQGIWKGTFEVPANWRREHKNGSANATPPPPPSKTTAKDSERTQKSIILIATMLASTVLDYQDVLVMLMRKFWQLCNGTYCLEGGAI